MTLSLKWPPNRAPIRRATPHNDVCLISCAECKPAVQPSIRVLLQSPHPFRHNRAGNLLWMNPCVLQLLVNVYPTVSQSMSRSVLWAFLPLSDLCTSFQRLPLNELSSLSPLTESGPTASEDALSLILRGGSSKASLVFCSFPFSVTRDQLLLRLLALAHSSLLTQPNE